MNFIGAAVTIMFFLVVMVHVVDWLRMVQHVRVLTTEPRWAGPSPGYTKHGIVQAEWYAQNEPFRAYRDRNEYDNDAS